MKKLLLVLVCVGLAVSPLTAGGGRDASAADSKVIKLGVLAPLTGTNAEFGKGFEVGMQMAVDRINAAGTSNGYKLELIIRDSKGDQKESSDLARQFADDEEILAILGDFTSGACMANAPIVDEAGIVQVSPTAAHPDYAGLSPWCFSTHGRQDVEAPFFARYIVHKYMGVKNVGLIYINSDWGQSSFQSFSEEAAKVGLNIAVAVNYVQDERDFSSLITRLRATPGLEAVHILDQGMIPVIINQIRGSGWDIPLTATAGTSGQLLDLAGKNGEGLLFSAPFFFDATPELTAWKEEFVSKAGFEPTNHPAFAYDTVGVVAAAIEACGSNPVTREAIRENLTKLTHNGIAGPIKFSPVGDITRQYLICGIENGRFVVKAGYDYPNQP